MKPREWWAWLKASYDVREDGEGQTTLGYLVEKPFRVEHIAFKVVDKDSYDGLMQQADRLAKALEWICANSWSSPDLAVYANDASKQFAEWKKSLK